MSTVTEAEMMYAMWASGSYGFMHRFMTTEKYNEQIKEFVRLCQESGIQQPINAITSIGVKGEELANNWLDNECLIAVIIDIAHGDSDSVCKTIKEVKTGWPHLDVIAGNIATKHGFLRMVDAGADAVRVGIGGGCFVPGSLVRTKTGLQPIETIKPGDHVYTHTGNLKPVKETFTYEKNEELMVVNGIECTKNHEYYVVERKDVDKITEDNLDQYAIWIAAEELTFNHVLVELE